MSDRKCGVCGRPLGKLIGTWVFWVLHCPACLLAARAGR